MNFILFFIFQLVYFVSVFFFLSLLTWTTTFLLLELQRIYLFMLLLAIVDINFEKIAYPKNGKSAAGTVAGRGGKNVVITRRKPATVPAADLPFFG